MCYQQSQCRHLHNSIIDVHFDCQGVNGVLQQRASILHLDQHRTNEDWNNCDTDCQYDWIDSSMI